MNINKKEPIQTTVRIILVLMSSFVLSLVLLDNRCSFEHVEPIRVPEGVDQIIGPMRTEVCSGPIIQLSAEWSDIIGWVQIATLPMMLLVIIIGVAIQLNQQ